MEKIKYARDRKRFGKYLRKLRGKMPLRAAAEFLRTPFGMIACIERGEPVKISMDFLDIVAKFYGVDIDEVCGHAQRIPQDVYWKIVNNPQLVEVIRNLEV
jgi:transcriptional regulator with XRE-family HTH domain